MTKSEQNWIAIQYIIAFRGEANWTQHIVPALKQMGIEPISRAMHRLFADGVIERVHPGVYRLANDVITPWRVASRSSLLARTPQGNELWYHPPTD